jgi:Uma2 family endonuclease
LFLHEQYRIIGKDDVDPDTDPLPDIAVEVDITNTSTTKFQIYANFRIPEIWRYDGKRVRFYRLTNDKYVEIPDSAVLLGLTSNLLGTFIEESRLSGQVSCGHSLSSLAFGTEIRKVIRGL